MMMILGSILLLTAAVVVVALLARLSSGKPGSVERFGLSGLAIALILGGTGMFAAEFIASSKRPEPSQGNPGNGNAIDPDATKPVAQLPAASEPLTQQDRANLDWLHRQTVEIFIDRPGFGMRRLMMPLQDVVTPPKLTSDSSAQVHLGQDGPSVKLDPAVAKLLKDRDPHFAFHDLINRRWRGAVEGNTEMWSVRSVQLVGLFKNPKPVVYDSNNVPGMKDVKDLPTRDLNVFESRALESLRSGERVVADKSGKEMKVMAPIFAGNRCLSCHEQKGQMLGAFSYVLELGPPPKKDDPSNIYP